MLGAQKIPRIFCTPPVWDDSLVTPNAARRAHPLAPAARVDTPLVDAVLSFNFSRVFPPNEVAANRSAATVPREIMISCLAKPTPP